MRLTSQDDTSRRALGRDRGVLISPEATECIDVAPFSNSSFDNQVSVGTRPRLVRSGSAAPREVEGCEHIVPWAPLMRHLGARSCLFAMHGSRGPTACRSLVPVSV